MSQYPTSADRFPPTERPLSGMALWSMILGIISLCLGPLGLVALVLGIIAITRTSKPDGPRGLGFAIAGTVIGAVGLLSTCLTIGILLPAIGKARQTAQMLLSQAQMRQIAVGVENYQRDNGRALPADGWHPVLSDYLIGEPDDPIFTSPLSDGDAVEYVFVPGDFAFDDRLIMFYEDPDHSVLRGEVNVVYDGGTSDAIPVEDLEAELQARGFVLQR
jgi:hypothetical protein